MVFLPEVISGLSKLNRNFLPEDSSLFDKSGFNVGAQARALRIRLPAALRFLQIGSSLFAGHSRRSFCFFFNYRSWGTIPEE